MDKLIEFLKVRNLDYSDAVIAKFERYYGLLIDYNNKFNLTSITDYQDVQTKHFIDSLYGLDYLSDNSTVLDIGSGAGFPTIPLAIITSNIKYTMVDSLLKRVNFLNVVIDELGLKNCTAIHRRAEDLDKNILYDYAISRAVAPLSTLMEYSAPFVKINGKIICYKGGNLDEEIKTIDNCLKELNCTVVKHERYELFSTDKLRTIIIFNKFGAVKSIYPRIQNKPRKEPL